MKGIKRLCMIVFSILVTWSLISGSGIAGPCIPCEQLATIDFGPEVIISSASMIDARMALGGWEPEHCEVRGTILPEIGFVVKLPTQWNNRFLMNGNVGAGGIIIEEFMSSALSEGFAVTANNTGHWAADQNYYSLTFNFYDWSFAYNPPDNSNPNAEQKVIDYAYRAAHENAVLAKQIIAAYYCDEPQYSYWNGCSTGGRQGLLEAQRYPEDFDGLIIGAPVNDFMGNAISHAWRIQAILEGAAIPLEKLPILAEAVYTKCDSIDGLVDGLIDDPRNCIFDPAAELPLCPGDVDGPDCFTAAQVETIAKIYDGARNSAGELLFPGQPLGAEVPGTGGWDSGLAGTPRTLTLEQALGLHNLLFGPPPPESPHPFDFDTDPPKMAAMGELLNATDPNLDSFKQGGGKIIHYHGWGDATVNPLASIKYYEEVLNLMGEDETKDFYKLYLVPGLSHCPPCHAPAFVPPSVRHCGDWLKPLMDWVEDGVAPDAIVDPIFENGEEVRTRTLCPYPRVARYTGEGSIDDAENFTCVDLEPAAAGTGIQITGTSSNITTNVMAGDTVEFTLETVIMDGAPVEYRFFTRAGYGEPDWGGSKWTIVQPYSADNTVMHTFDVPGIYFLVGHVIHPGDTWVFGYPQSGIAVEVWPVR